MVPAATTVTRRNAAVTSHATRKLGEDDNPPRDGLRKQVDGRAILDFGAERGSAENERRQRQQRADHQRRQQRVRGPFVRAGHQHAIVGEEKPGSAVAA